MPPEYRLLAYLTPSLISFIINAIRLISTGTNFKYYIRKYPQILIASCFTPFMFEHVQLNGTYSIRIWKLGTILNAFFIGFLPQIVLLITNFQRGIVDWDFISIALSDEGMYENNNALFKSRYGTTWFAVISCLVFATLNFLFFSTEMIFKNNGLYCKCFTILCFPCPQNCSNLSSQLSTSLDIQTDPNTDQFEGVLENSMSGENSKENGEPHTLIFFYTRENKQYVTGKPLAEKEMKLTEV